MLHSWVRNGHKFTPCMNKNNVERCREKYWVSPSLFSSWPPLSPEKAMAPHSSTPAWKIPWTEEPGSLQSMGSRRVRHDWATSLSLFTYMHWRRKWQPILVFLPGKSQRQEPGGLPSMGSHGVGHDWRDLAATAAAAERPKVKRRLNFVWPRISPASLDHEVLCSGEKWKF